MNNLPPPKIPTRIFELFCGSAQAEDLLGDLEEIYRLDSELKPGWLAKLRYWKNCMALLTSYTIRKRKKDASFHFLSNSNNSTSMIKNYFKVAYRNLRKQKFFTTINIIGLSVGMSVSLLLIAVIADVYDYDKFHEKKDRIYRVITRTYDGERVNTYASSPPQAFEALNHSGGIEKIARLNRGLSGDVYGAEKNLPMHGFFIDPSFFDIFSFPFAEGNAETALSSPNNLIITKNEAEKLFGKEPAMGRQVEIPPFGEFIISGVLKELPKRSHLNFGILASFEKLKALQKDGIVTPKTYEEFYSEYTYLLLDEQASASTSEQILARVSEENKSLAPDVDVTMRLQALSDFNFGQELSDSPGPQWDLVSMIIFGIISLLILLPACLNYSNLSIARALQRAREIGVRKVLGGEKKQIFFQFIVESMLIFFIAFLAAYVLFLLIRPEFLGILAEPSRAGIDLRPSPTMLIFFIIFVLVSGFLIGLIPAMHFSRMRALNALKHNLNLKRSGRFNIRKIMLTGQFTLSIGFIMAVVIVMDQYRYSLNYSYGFDKENILNVRLKDVEHDQWSRMTANLADVSDISYSSALLGLRATSSSWVQTDNDSIEADRMFIDNKFIPLHNINLLLGENLTDNRTSGTDIIVNRQFVDKMGLGSVADAIGATVKLPEYGLVQIIGVTDNFNYTELRNEVRPFYFIQDSGKLTYSNMKIVSGDIFSTLSLLEDKWSVWSEREFDATFLSDDIDEVYSWYLNMVKMIGFLGLLAISISCLGLLGMVVFAIQARTREVGIRKVHGASNGRIVFLLSRDYLLLMFIACLVGIPVTYILFSKIMPFLQFYSAKIGPAPIVVSVLLLFLFGAATVVSQTLKAARRNPVDTLRYE